MVFWLRQFHTRSRPLETIDTLIIGAGPAGLTTAYSLVKAGRKVLVIEQDPHYVGGISRTVNYKGFLFDIGGHRFFSKSKEIVDLWNEILPDDFIERPRLSRIFYRCKFYTYPLKAFEALRNLGIFQSFLCIASFAYAKAFPIGTPKTFHQWVRNQFGERLFSIFFKTYTEKVWGMGCDEISADWAAQRIKGLSLGAAVLDGLRRSLGWKKGAGNNDGEVVRTLIEFVSLSAPRPRHDVGSLCAKNRRARRPHPDGPQSQRTRLRCAQKDLDGDRHVGLGRNRDLLRARRRLVCAGTRTRGGTAPGTFEPSACARIEIS